MYTLTPTDALPSLNLPTESLFTTDIDLWEVYLDQFTSPDARQYHNCSTCKNFIRQYGGLVTIDPVTGKPTSAVWSLIESGNAYQPITEALKEAVEGAKVTGVFLSSQKTLGTSITGDWEHFSVRNPLPYRGRALTAGQAMAEKREDFRNIARALPGFSMDVLTQAHSLIYGDALYHSEKLLGQIEWLLNLKTFVKAYKNSHRRNNIIWKAIADAPAGFCHPRSSMIGTLLEDLESGKPFEQVKASFAAKMHPLRYQRPTAAPTDNAIQVAEKLVKTLGVENSMGRTYASQEDLELLWEPTENTAPKSEGVFGHLKETKKAPIVTSGGNITWVKFLNEVLPAAQKIEVIVPSGRANFTTLVTAADPEAPSLFQWDNPISWYHWHGGSTASSMGLIPGPVEVTGICYPPYMWGNKHLTHYGKDVYFLLKGARESQNRGSALFPETLKSEFHGIRKVIEAHSRNTQIQATDKPHAIGLGIGSKVRVHTNIALDYVIDRWD